jgi:hypothetical protein
MNVSREHICNSRRLCDDVVRAMLVAYTCIACTTRRCVLTVGRWKMAIACTSTLCELDLRIIELSRVGWREMGVKVNDR